MRRDSVFYIVKSKIEDEPEVHWVISPSLNYVVKDYRNEQELISAAMDKGAEISHVTNYYGVSSYFVEQASKRIISLLLVNDPKEVEIDFVARIIFYKEE